MSIAFKKEDGDLVLSSVGRLVRIGNQEKLAQEVADEFLTDYDPVRGRGSELAAYTKNMSGSPMMPMFGEAFLAKIIEDSLNRLAVRKARDPRSVPAEKIDQSKTQIDIRHPTKKTYLFYANVYSETGTPYTAAYRVRLRHQYPNRDARTVFPAGIITDDSVP